MKLNHKIRRQMCEDITKEALGPDFDQHNKEVRVLAQQIMAQRWHSHISGYEKVLNSEQIDKGFERDYQFKVHLDGDLVDPPIKKEPGTSGTNKRALSLLGFFPDSLNGRDPGMRVLGEDCSGHYTWSKNDPYNHMWRARTLVTPHMRRNALIDLTNEEIINEIGQGTCDILTQKVLRMLKERAHLLNTAYGFWATTHDALASCNSSNQIREMLPAVVRFLPPEPVKAVVPVEQLSKANDIMKKGLAK